MSEEREIHPDRDLIAEQIAYYRARAPEYDEWFLRQGRYDRGEVHRAQWQRELAEVEAALAGLGRLGKVLELAAGTGLWTQKLAPRCAGLTAVDASPEVLALNRRRVGAPNVRYLEADLFNWRPSERYDLVFMGFWLSHVPAGRFDAFWRMVKTALAPGGKVFFVDSAHNPESTARDHVLTDQGVVERRLNDGRSFELVKVFYRPAELERRLAGLGFTGTVKATEAFFIYGCFEPSEAETPQRLVAKCWDTAAAARQKAGVRGWLDSRFVWDERLNRKVAGAPEEHWLLALIRRLGVPPTGRWLSLGCGNAHQEIGLAGCGVFAAMDAVDLSGESLEQARRKAAAAGVERIVFHQHDLADFEPEPGVYDVVLMLMALHHVEALDALFDRIETALRPGGFFIFNEYVGPRQLQLGQRQLGIVRDLLAALPERLRIDLESGEVKRDYVCRPVAWWNEVDPSESISSDRIVPEVAERFEVVERIDYGGTLLSPLLEHVIHNFEPDNPDHRTVLRLLGSFEDVLIREGVLTSDFTVMAVARRDGRVRRAPAGPPRPELPEIDRLRAELEASRAQLRAIEGSRGWRWLQGLRGLAGRRW